MKPKFRTKYYIMICAILTTFSVSAPKPAAAQADPFLGQLALVGFNFCPRGWSSAEGQLLSIAQNNALFALLGTIYGGDGRTTFALPDLRGRSPIGIGTGPGLTSFREGQRGGTETTTLTVANMPSHSHDVHATNVLGDKGGPGGKFLASGVGTAGLKRYNFGPPNKIMNSAMIGNTGGGQSFENRDPYLAMRWCIATQGVFPSRN
jgi:microcystin-dependent protein